MNTSTREQSEARTRARAQQEQASFHGPTAQDRAVMAAKEAHSEASLKGRSTGPAIVPDATIGHHDGTSPTGAAGTPSSMDSHGPHARAQGRAPGGPR